MLLMRWAFVTRALPVLGNRPVMAALRSEGVSGW
jgi:hypothetical protein